jgi:hypothetical protein
MVRLPYNQNTTFQDLRHEIEEDYGNDFPFSDFRFVVTVEGMAVSLVQEHKLRVCDYILTNQGSIGTVNNPHHVFVRSVKKENKREEEKDGKEEKNKDKVEVGVRWVEGEGEKEERGRWNGRFVTCVFKLGTCPC